MDLARYPLRPLRAVRAERPWSGPLRLPPAPPLVCHTRRDSPRSVDEAPRAAAGAVWRSRAAMADPGVGLPHAPRARRAAPTAERRYPCAVSAQPLRPADPHG